jgi:CheY-like chemotaxis protein
METILVVVDDLFFLARIRETAAQVGVGIEFVAPDQLTARIQHGRPRAVILDLNCRTASAADLVRALKNGPWSKVPVVGFVSHVQGDLIAAAKEAGCDTVLARSAFTRDLPALLGRLANP